MMVAIGDFFVIRMSFPADSEIRDQQPHPHFQVCWRSSQTADLIIATLSATFDLP
jgi:predicted lipoprotein